MTDQTTPQTPQEPRQGANRAGPAPGDPPPNPSPQNATERLAVGLAVQQGCPVADLPTDRDALIERLCERYYRALAGSIGWDRVPIQGQDDRRASMAAVLALLEAEGWGPCASRCRHHDGYCSDIVGANEDLGEALVTARAEVERLRAENAEQLTEIERHLSAYGRQAELLDQRNDRIGHLQARLIAAEQQLTLLALADRLDGEYIHGVPVTPPPSTTRSLVAEPREETAP